jgi:hypothetical protein
VRRAATTRSADLDRHIAEGLRGHRAAPAVLGDDPRAGTPPVRVTAGDDGTHRVLARRQGDDVTDLQRGQQCGGLLLPLLPGVAAGLPFGDGQFPAQPGVVDDLLGGDVGVDLLQGAGQVLLQSGEVAAALGEPGGLLHDVGGGLVLGEGAVEDPLRILVAAGADEVDGHVVAGPECRVQRVGAGLREVRDRVRVDPRAPQHDRVTFGVLAAASGAPGELRVLARGEVDVRLPVELH